MTLFDVFWRSLTLLTLIGALDALLHFLTHFTNSKASNYCLKYRWSGPVLVHFLIIWSIYSLCCRLAKHYDSPSGTEALTWAPQMELIRSVWRKKSMIEYEKKPRREGVLQDSEEFLVVQSYWSWLWCIKSNDHLLGSRIKPDLFCIRWSAKPYFYSLCLWKSSHLGLADFLIN